MELPFEQQPMSSTPIQYNEFNFEYPQNSQNPLLSPVTEPSSSAPAPEAASADRRSESVADEGELPALNPSLNQQPDFALSYWSRLDLPLEFSPTLAALGKQMSQEEFVKGKSARLAECDYSNTRICKRGNRCKQKRYCSYAHSMKELRSTTNVYKLQTCSKMKEGRVPCNPHMCRFSHAQWEHPLLQFYYEFRPQEINDGDAVNHVKFIAVVNLFQRNLDNLYPVDRPADKEAAKKQEEIGTTYLEKQIWRRNAVLIPKQQRQDEYSSPWGKEGSPDLQSFQSAGTMDFFSGLERMDHLRRGSDFIEGGPEEDRPPQPMGYTPQPAPHPQPSSGMGMGFPFYSGLQSFGSQHTMTNGMPSMTNGGSMTTGMGAGSMTNGINAGYMGLCPIMGQPWDAGRIRALESSLYGTDQGLINSSPSSSYSVDQQWSRYGSDPLTGSLNTFPDRMGNVPNMPFYPQENGSMAAFPMPKPVSYSGSGGIHNDYRSSM